jgi:hypothetical protein
LHLEADGAVVVGLRVGGDFGEHERAGVVEAFGLDPLGV